MMTKKFPQLTQWRTELKSMLTLSAASADDFADAQIRKLRKRFGVAGKPKIQPYIGFTGKDTVHLHGRILSNPPLDVDFSDDRWWNNLADTVQRFTSDELPGVSVRARMGNTFGEAVSDAEGYFHIKLNRQDVGDDLPFWSTVALAITNHDRVSAVESATTCEVMTSPPDASHGLISDVDDTILHTGATNLGTMAKLTLFGTARTRAPLAGVAAWYQALHRGTNPVFYVSSSPWNLYDLLRDFIELNAIPNGPILLRDLGIDRNKFIKSGHDHKLDKARRLINWHPELDFVLSGDSGQQDARLYAQAAEEFGDRVRAIFIRDVDPMSATDHDEKVDEYVRKSDRFGVPMFLVRDSLEAAARCVELGLLEKERLTEIEVAVGRDKERSVNLLMP